MRSAEVFINSQPAGILAEIAMGVSYRFTYYHDYHGIPISLTMPLSAKIYLFDRFPPFFDGLLPEGIMLEGLLRQCKIDESDYFSQLIAVGNDLVGAVTVREIVA